MVISPSKINWNLIFCAYWIISRDASLEPIFKGHSLLFILAIYLLPKYTVLNLVSGSKFNSATKFSTTRVVCVHTAVLELLNLVGIRILYGPLYHGTGRSSTGEVRQKGLFAP